MPDTASTSKPAVRLVIADSSWLVRDGLARLASELDPSCDVCTAADGSDLHQTLRSRPDTTFVLIGVDMVAGEEDVLFAHIRKLAPGAAIGIVGSPIRHDSALRAIACGALGAVNLDESRDLVLDALAKLFAGEAVVTWPVPHASAAAVPPNGPGQDLDVLTPRERDVFGLLGDGLSVALIAADLRLSPHTVRVHIARIMKKLDLRNRSALMHSAVSRQAPRRPIAPPSAERRYDETDA